MQMYWVSLLKKVSINTRHTRSKLNLYRIGDEMILHSIQAHSWAYTIASSTHLTLIKYDWTIHVEYNFDCQVLLFSWVVTVQGLPRYGLLTKPFYSKYTFQLIQVHWKE